MCVYVCVEGRRKRTRSDKTGKEKKKVSYDDEPAIDVVNVLGMYVLSSM
jgi:hypothetical protein